MQVVGIYYRHAVASQAGEDLAFGTGDIRYRTKAGEMGALGIVDQGNRWSGDIGQVGNFARMVHAHFDHGAVMFATQLQQGQWQADIVVEIAGRGQHAVLAEVGTQNRGAHLLDGCLAVAAGDANQRQVKTLAPMRRELPESQAGVDNGNQRQVGIYRCPFLRHQCANRTLR